MDRAGNIKECLINRHPLDARGEVMEDSHDVVAELLIAPEVAADEKEIATQPPGPPPGHATADTVPSRFIRSRQHHSPAYGDRPVPQ
jgi:hypothetical protein